MSWLITLQAIEWAIRLTMLVVVLRRRFRPPTSLAWLTIVFFAPMVGMVLYLLLAGNRLGKRRVRQYRHTSTAIRNDSRQSLIARYANQPNLAPELSSVLKQAEQIGGMPILGGNHVELLPDVQGTIDRLIRDIDEARHHVHLLFYIYADDATGHRVAEAVCRASARGVQCRLLADAAGSRSMLRSSLLGRMRSAGVHVHPMLPVKPLRRKFARLDLRNHRKIAVIDGTVAYTGSQNIVDTDYGHKRAGKWIDLMGRFTGPVVGQIQMVFLEDWIYETGQSLDTPDILPTCEPTGRMFAQAIPTGPVHDSQTFQRVLLAAINAASRKVIISTPYLIPDEPTMVALLMAADRGVDTHIVMPERCDHPLVGLAGRAYFEELLDAGVHIHTHRAGLLHSKTMTVDDAFALLGSANIDIRSFDLNFEINVLMYGPEITAELRFAQTRYITESLEVDLTGWRNRPRWKRYAESAAALFSPVM
jgi:cardiolipin synthase